MSEAGAEGLVERIRAAILRGTADEVNGQPNGDIIVKGCEAAEYVDPENAAASFVDCIVDEIRPFLEANARALAEAGAEIERLRAEQSAFLEELGDVEVAGWSSAAFKLKRVLDAAEENERADKAALTASERQRDEALEALRPFADFKNCSAADVYRARELTGLLHLNEADNLARSVLEYSKAGLADANSKEPLSQDQEIAGLREEVRRKDERIGELVRVVRLYCGHDKLTDGLKIGALANHPYFAPLDGEA